MKKIYTQYTVYICTYISMYIPMCVSVYRYRYLCLYLYIYDIKDLEDTHQKVNNPLPNMVESGVIFIFFLLLLFSKMFIVVDAVVCHPDPSSGMGDIFPQLLGVLSADTSQ